MSFRIDAVQRQEYPDGTCWEWDIKGIYGQGIYGTLLTGPGGRGLYLFKWPDRPNDNLRIPLCPEEEFQVSLDTPPAKAAHMLAATLTRLGWGPERDQAGQVIKNDGRSRGARGKNIE
ncbi:MAG: hypothetical protein ACYC9L_03630 [Sulfuricaulis sp.]